MITELNTKFSNYGISVSYLETQRKYKFVAGATERTINVIRHHPEKVLLDDYIQTLDSKKTDLRNSLRGTNEYINLSQEIDKLNDKISEINTFKEDYKENSIYQVLGFTREDLVLSAYE